MFNIWSCNAFEWKITLIKTSVDNNFESNLCKSLHFSHCHSILTCLYCEFWFYVDFKELLLVKMRCHGSFKLETFEIKIMEYILKTFLFQGFLLVEIGFPQKSKGGSSVFCSVLALLTNIKTGFTP
jgi:hypothetical protein